MQGKPEEEAGTDISLGTQGSWWTFHLLTEEQVIAQWSFIKTTHLVFAAFSQLSFISKSQNQRLYTFALFFFFMCETYCPRNCFAINLERRSQNHKTHMAAAGLLLPPWGLDSVTAAQAPPHTQSFLTAGISLLGLGMVPVSSKHLWLPHEFVQLNEDTSQFSLFFKQITDDATKSQTPETSVSLTDAKLNAPIHFEDKNVNNVV